MEEIKDDLPAHFKVFPMAVIPQTGYRGPIILDLSGCRGSIILDLSFLVPRPPQKGKKH